MRPWNASAVARACRAGLATLALVILLASLAEAFYGPRTTIGNNYQQWSDTQSLDGINPGTCNNNPLFHCFVLFQRIPQQKPLIVQHVSCQAVLDIGPPNTMGFVHLRTRQGETFVRRTTSLVPVNTLNTIWIVNSPVMHLIKSGERPVIHFGTPTDGDFQCSISGRLQ